MEFSNNYKMAVEQFKQYVDEIFTNARPKRPDMESPIPFDERKRITSELCDAWMNHSLSCWSGPIDKDGHEYYRYTPPPYQLERIGQILLWK